VTDRQDANFRADRDVANDVRLRHGDLPPLAADRPAATGHHNQAFGDLDEPDLQARGRRRTFLTYVGRDLLEISSA